MKPFRKITIAYLVCSAALFMAGTTLLPAAGLGGLVRDAALLTVAGVVLYGLLTVQTARRDDAAEPAAEIAPVPEVPVPPAESSDLSLRRAA